MEPYTEAQAWRDFHTEMITGFRAALMPLLAPKYAVRIEEWVYSGEAPEGDHYVLVARGYRLPFVEVYAWNLGSPCPRFLVPLLRSDSDVLLNLQEVYEQVYERARYDVQLDFTQSLPFETRS
uniref:DUF4058 family protein n=1 Tax=uncultured prokaryote TaxID=198431 RepID=H5S9G1_9ZZZZ|nr:hypothetical protein HGMM_F03C06C02 [uncultured prokaryote]